MERIEPLSQNIYNNRSIIITYTDFCKKCKKVINKFDEVIQENNINYHYTCKRLKNL